MKALLVVDVQYDFLPGGALAVPDGDRIIPVINGIANRFEHVLQTQDWHPAGHMSFASSHNGRKPFETIEVSYGSQILWPDHCIQGSKGAEFHKDLHIPSSELIIRKGFRKNIDSYSTFYENDHKTPTGLTGYLRERGIDEIYLAGLATDFCVKWSAVDGIKERFKVTVVTDAVAGIDIDNSVTLAWDEMIEKGVKSIHSSELSS